MLNKLNSLLKVISNKVKLIKKLFDFFQKFTKQEFAFENEKGARIYSLDLLNKILKRNQKNALTNFPKIEIINEFINYFTQINAKICLIEINKNFNHFAADAKFFNELQKIIKLLEFIDLHFDNEIYENQEIAKNQIWEQEKFKNKENKNLNNSNPQNLKS